MKIMFVQLPTSHFGAGERVYPLGLSRLSSLVEMSHTITGLDMNLHMDPWPELKSQILNNKPDIVALSLRNIDPLANQFVSYVSSLRTAAKLIRAFGPKIKIVAGGPAFSLFPEKLMSVVPEIDFGFVGEAELSFTAFITSDFSEKTPGLVWREADSIIMNPSQVKLNMNELPLLNSALFSPADYFNLNSYVAFMGIEGKRGCDLCCSYCLYPALGGKKMRLRDPKLIANEMEWLKKQYSIKLFHFTDPVLNRPKAHFVELCQEINRRKLDVAWTGFFREDAVDIKSLELAMKAGLVAVYFSGDSLSSKGLITLRKNMDMQAIIHASEISAKCGVLTMCHFLINLPNDTREDIDESKKNLEIILGIHAPVGNLGAVIFNNIRLYPSAPITKDLIKSGSLSPNVDLLYPIYYNPPETSHVLHEFEAFCHTAGVFSRIGYLEKEQQSLCV